MLDATLAAIAADMHADAGKLVADVVATYLAQCAEGHLPVSPPVDPARLAAQFGAPFPARGRQLDEIIADAARDIVAGSIRLSHPMYLGHQVSAPLPAAVWAESLIAAMNNSLAVREMSPTGTPVETALIRKLAALAGWGEGAGGTFTSGGTEATLTALLAARARTLPDSWRSGAGSGRPVLVCGEHAHYAVTRAAGIIGIGLENVVAVPSTDFRMDSGALSGILDTLDEEKRRVVAVVATAGSTATGSFDDLDTIGRICAARDLWLHVDGAHGASALFSVVHRRRMHGLEHARSLAWDPHKMLLAPLGTGMLLVREERELDAAFAQEAPYLFHGVDDVRTWDLGTRSLLCSRPFDALKLWVILERYGTDGVAALYDHLSGLAGTLAAMLRAHPTFIPLHEPEANILCFALRGGEGESADQRTRQLRAAYNASGEGWITTTRLEGRQVLRVTIMNPRTTTAHLARLVDTLDRLSVSVSLTPP